MKTKLLTMAIALFGYISVFAHGNGNGHKKHHHNHGHHDHYVNNNSCNNNNYNYNNSCGNNNYVSMFSPQEFFNLKVVISKNPFDSGKLNIIVQAMMHNHFTSGQVLELMQLMTFDSYKLEVAKMMYPKTVDPQNFFMVNNAFTFNSYSANLLAYINSL